MRSFCPPVGVRPRIFLMASFTSDRLACKSPRSPAARRDGVYGRPFILRTDAGHRRLLSHPSMVASVLWIPCCNNCRRTLRPEVDGPADLSALFHSSATSPAAPDIHPRQDCPPPSTLMRSLSPPSRNNTTSPGLELHSPSCAGAHPKHRIGAVDELPSRTCNSHHSVNRGVASSVKSSPV